MIIVKLIGGLGNQMFQYALGRRLSLARNALLKLDLSWYLRDSSRSYGLDEFNIQAEVASKAEVEKFIPTGLSGIRRRLFFFQQNHKPYEFRKVITEPSFSYNPEIVNKTPDEAYLLGYWQTEKYFKEVSSVIRDDFTPLKTFSSVFQRCEEKIANQVTASLHVRRGDYVSDPRYQKKYLTCSLTYYKRAINKLRETSSDLNVYVFSDDIEWARNELVDCQSLSFVGREDDLTDLEELILMSKCNHHIISNSTYGWWGAWLNQKPGKMVIAPFQWFADKKMQTQSDDNIPEDWTRL